ncbi:MAG: hypothetical protein GOP50_05440 [Candidatus Heimdallarchaeota archaeon]|nr:hypothetical protein [Candidatus Heimdallarchaeota archaeon]
MQPKEYDFCHLNRKNRLAGTANELSPDQASLLGEILGIYLGGEEAVVVSARDYRKDTRMISRAFNAGLISVGTTVFELHACSLPVVQFALRRFSAHAGVHMAAAHRTADKINIRIFDQTGIEIPFTDIYSKNKINKKPIVRAPPDKIADILSVKQANDLYRAALSSALGTEVLRQQNFSVVIDCAFGPVAEVFPNILVQNGCNVLALNAFKPENIPASLPNPTSLSILSRTIVAANGDLGIAFDPSGSRAIYLDEHGRIIDPCVIVSVLLQDKMIGRKQGKVVLSNTLWMMEKWLNNHNIDVHFTSEYPGEISRTIQFQRAIFGANEQGNYIHPTISNGSEPFASTMLLLSSFARDEKHKYISTFVEDRDICSKEIYEDKPYSLVSNPDLFLKKIYEKDNENKIINTLNGVKIIHDERKWSHIFSTIIPSKLKIRVCAENKEERESIMSETMMMVENLDGELS